MSRIVLFPIDSPPWPMNSETFEEASKVVPDPQLLINIVSRRVRQLCAGSRPLFDADPRMGFLEIALAEVAQGKIEVVHSPGSEQTQVAA